MITPCQTPKQHRNEDGPGAAPLGRLHSLVRRVRQTVKEWLILLAVLAGIVLLVAVVLGDLLWPIIRTVCAWKWITR